MKIRIISPWKQEDAFGKKESEYLKRLQNDAKIVVDEIKGEQGEGPDALKKEGKKLLSRVSKGSFLVALSEKGKSFDSMAFSRWLEEMGIKGRSDITFVIGSSAGLDSSLVEEAHMLLSLSPMTFPHQMARVMLVEQIYRAFTLIKGGPYHK
ncbi:MAG: 23S rRNA (pseudouridine(1915)-N(3))-methyltransferase RlmH [bacterium]|nr:23S rRNA (pseudouridine(1915)-N(3))-methyltransferase RlmH [bacterium]